MITLRIKDPFRFKQEMLIETIKDPLIIDDYYDPDLKNTLNNAFKVSVFRKEGD